MQNGKFMNAKFASKCNETENVINKGDEIFYVPSTKKAYDSSSNRFNSEGETLDTGNMIQANENAYFDDFCQNNNI